MKNEVNITVELRVFIARKYRTQTNAAKAWGCSAAFVSAVVCGEKDPNETMLADAGFKRIRPDPIYVRIHKGAKK